MDELGIELNVVHTSKWVQNAAEQLTILLFGQNVAPWVYTLFIQQIFVDQMVAYFVSREAEHQDNFLCTSCNTF